MKTIEEQLALVNETVSYYTKEKKERAINNEGDCSYYTKGNMCAVGRCLINPKDKDRILKGKINSNTSVIRLLDTFSENIFKKDYRGFSKGLWIYLQNFHDANLNFNGFKLTQQGKDYIKNLKKQIKNGRFN